MLTAEQYFYLSAVAPVKPRDKEDLLFIVRENIETLDDQEIRRIALSCITALLQMDEEAYSGLVLVERT